ncbi:hypothetical protein [Lacunisphaera limnophila]|uniref:hypothetical protein n=1 Tax=Lacunisphaera limnophila TaxID=1838286 RepID=UPI00085977F4|nr:hypothetical protein [Lacunisphaera limnophila]
MLFTTTSRAAEATPADVPEVNHWVYLSELPEPADLMASAATNGLTVDRIDRTAERVVVTYKYDDGLKSSIGYALLSSAGSTDRVVGRVTRTTPTTTVVERTVVEREPEIIYVDRTPRTRVVYRDYRDDFWLPLTVGLGIGYISGHNSHGHYYPRYSGHYRSYRGGYRGRH